MIICLRLITGPDQMSLNIHHAVLAGSASLEKNKRQSRKGNPSEPSEPFRLEWNLCTFSEKCSPATTDSTAAHMRFLTLEAFGSNLGAGEGGQANNNASLQAKASGQHG